MMTYEISAAWNKIEHLFDRAMTALPNFVLALLVFLLFYFAAKAVKVGVSHATVRHRLHRNLGLVLGRVS